MAENDAQCEWALPDGWARTTLESVATIQSGVGFPKALQGRTGGDYPLAKVSDISDAVLHNDGVLSGAANYISAEEIQQIRGKVYPPGATLFAKIGEAVRLNRRAIAAVPILVDNNVMGLIPETNETAKYLFYFMHTVDLYEYSRATTVPSVRKSDVAQILIPLAPLPEQRRIVAEIETQFTRLGAAVAALERAQANIRRYKAAMLQAACEGRLVPTEAELARAEGRDYEPADQLLVRILAERRAKWEADYLEKQRAKDKEPKDDKWKQKYKKPALPDIESLPELSKGWVWASLEQLSWQSGYGTSQKCTYEAPGPPVLRIPNVVNGTIELDDLKFATNPEKLSKTDEVVPGDLLIIRTNGSRPLIGRSALIRKSFDRPHLFASYLIRYRLLEVPQWIATAWDAPIMREWLERSAATSAGQYNLSVRVLNRLPIPLPPSSEQHRIVAEVERRLSLVAALEASVAAALARAGRLRQAVLKQAFEGRLVPQDPNDEPASVLLEQIRAEREVGKKGGRTNRKRKQLQQLQLPLD